MMVFAQLFYEFFKIGLFAVGGGPATLPFLFELAEKYPWFTHEELTDMIAIAESTPGPIGINMATYAGYHAAGLLGAILATLSLVLPSVIVILVIARFLKTFRDNRYVNGTFAMVRPAVAALIAVAIWQILKASLLTVGEGGAYTVLGTSFDVRWWLVGLTAVMFGLMQIKPLKKCHPVVWLLAGGLIGVLFKL